jgi:hypothetical protein
MSGNNPPPPPLRTPSPRAPCPVTTSEVAQLLKRLGQLSTAMAAQAEASVRTLVEAERQRTADPTARTTAV